MLQFGYSEVYAMLDMIFMPTQPAEFSDHGSAFKTACELMEIGKLRCESTSPRGRLSNQSTNSSTSSSDYESAKVCHKCSEVCYDKFIAVIDDTYFHINCLKCEACSTSLGFDQTCYMRNGQIYCKSDYLLFKTACARCNLAIQNDEMMQKSRDKLFHVSCFTCFTCGNELLAGEVYRMNQKNRLFCHLHYDQMDEESEATSEHSAKADSEETEEFADEDTTNHNRSKRMRTSFKHHQLRTMKQYFNLNHNPDAKDLKNLAHKTGLTKRVLQVWFQNARAKYRRSMQGHEAGLEQTAMPVLSAEHHPVRVESAWSH